jgi:hypothetical protein
MSSSSSLYSGAQTEVSSRVDGADLATIAVLQERYLREVFRYVLRRVPRQEVVRGPGPVPRAPAKTAHRGTIPWPSRTVTIRSTSTCPSFSTRPLDHRTSTSSTLAALPSPNRHTPSLALQ